MCVTFLYQRDALRTSILGNIMLILLTIEQRNIGMLNYVRKWNLVIEIKIWWLQREIFFLPWKLSLSRPSNYKPDDFCVLPQLIFLAHMENLKHQCLEFYGVCMKRHFFGSLHVLCCTSIHKVVDLLKWSLWFVVTNRHFLHEFLINQFCFSLCNLKFTRLRWHY